MMLLIFPGNHQALQPVLARRFNFAVPLSLRASSNRNRNRRKIATLVALKSGQGLRLEAWSCHIQGPKSPKSLKKVFPGLSRPGVSKKVPKKSQRTRKRVQKVSKSVLEGFFDTFLTLVSNSDPTEIPPPPSRDRCSNTPVAQCLLWYRRLSLLYPHFFHKSGPSQSRETGLGAGYRRRSLPLKPIAL